MFPFKKVAADPDMPKKTYASLIPGSTVHLYSSSGVMLRRFVFRNEKWDKICRKCTWF